MLSKLLRQFLFYLIHWVVNLLVAVQILFRRLCDKNSSSPDDHVTKRDIIKLLENVPKMKKKLNHLVVLVDTKVHSLNELAKLVIWSLVLGIPYVSFYDTTGQLKKNEDDLFMEIERNKKGIPGCIKWANKPDLNGYTNGTQPNKIYVNIFSQRDGKVKIAQCIKLMAKGDICYTRNSEELTAQELNETLVNVYSDIPEPDLAFYTGPLCCTSGLLPWHIRLTEFVRVSVNHNININSYLGALYKYNKCDQRFGK